MIEQLDFDDPEVQKRFQEEYRKQQRYEKALKEKIEREGRGEKS